MDSDFSIAIVTSYDYRQCMFWPQNCTGSCSNNHSPRLLLPYLTSISCPASPPPHFTPPTHSIPTSAISSSHFTHPTYYVGCLSGSVFSKLLFATELRRFTMSVEIAFTAILTHSPMNGILWENNHTGLGHSGGVVTPHPLYIQVNVAWFSEYTASRPVIIHLTHQPPSPTAPLVDR